MRRFLALAVILALPLLGFAQEEELRFGVRQNTDLYPQNTPKRSVTSLLRVLDKERYDYLVAWFMDPGYVDEQLSITFPKFEKLARDQVRSENLERKGVSRDDIRKRVTDLANQANFDHLVQRVRSKLDSDPENVKNLRKIAREGEVQDETADTAAVRRADIKDRTIYLRKFKGNWCIENKYSEEKVGE